jgi:phage FluMu gp28-like protein
VADGALQVEAFSEAVPLSAGDREEALDMVAARADAQPRDLIRRPEDVPYILTPYQRRWHADLSAVRLGCMSRRIGKSWGCYAAEGALEAAAAEPLGMDQLYQGFNREMAAEQIADVAFWARALEMAAETIAVSASKERRVTRDATGRVLAEEEKSILRYRVDFASGHKYEALSSNPWALRGQQGHSRIDEGAYHADLDEVVTAALAFLLLGGRVSIISSVDTEDDQFWAYVREMQAGELNWRLHLVTLDDAVAEGYYRNVVCLKKGIAYDAEQERVWRDDAFSRYPDPAKANAELLCIPRRGSGLYFSRAILEQCMIDGVPIVRWNGANDLVTDPERLALAQRWCDDELGTLLLGLAPDQPSVYAQDFARSADLSPIRIFQREAGGRWVERLLVELRNLPFDVQALIRDYLLDRLPLLHGAGFDARGNGSSHAEAALQKYGARVVLVTATPAWYDLWFPKYRAMHESREIGIAKSEDIIADHRLVELRAGRPRMADGKVKGSDGRERHGDTASAGVIACSVMLAEGQPAAGATVDPGDTRDVYEPSRMAGRRRVGR